MYKLDASTYPSCIDGIECDPELNELGWDIKTVSSNGFNSSGILYMKLVPKEKLSNEYDILLDDCSNAPNLGCNPTFKLLSKISYSITFVLEDSFGDIKAGLNCATQNGITAGRC